MTAVLHGIRNCDTMRKAAAWLNDHGVDYAFHDYRKAGVDRAMLERWCAAAGWEAVLNRAGTTFRKLPEAEKAGLDRDRAVALMLAQPAMIRRPVLEAGAILEIGFAPARYEALFGG